MDKVGTKRIGDRLQKKSGTLVAPPEGFYVKGTEGLVKDGELQHADSWAKEDILRKL